jgi:hypothetical protein
VSRWACCGEIQFVERTKLKGQEIVDKLEKE